MTHYYQNIHGWFAFGAAYEEAVRRAPVDGGVIRGLDMLDGMG